MPRRALWRERARLHGLPPDHDHPTMVQRVIRTYQLRSRRQRLIDAGLIPLTQMALSRAKT